MWLVYLQGPFFSATVKTVESGYVGYYPVLSYWQPSCFTDSRKHPEQIQLDMLPKNQQNESSDLRMKFPD